MIHIREGEPSHIVDCHDRFWAFSNRQVERNLVAKTVENVTTILCSLLSQRESAGERTFIIEYILIIRE